MTLTEEEIGMVECLRDWSSAGKSELKLTAALTNGVWECTLTTAIIDEQVRKRMRLPSERVMRGVGTSFVEAFNNLDFNDTGAL
jgi:hypothetical protein